MIQTKVESDIFFTVIKTIVGQNWKCQIFTANSSQLQDSGENETEWKNPDDGRKIFPFKLRHKKIKHALLHDMMIMFLNIYFGQCL
jgi:hypothetical protein